MNQPTMLLDVTPEELELLRRGLFHTLARATIDMNTLRTFIPKDETERVHAQETLKAIVLVAQALVTLQGRLIKFMPSAVPPEPVTPT